MAENQQITDFKIDRNPNWLRNSIISMVVFIFLIVGGFLITKISVSQQTVDIITVAALLVFGFILYVACTGKIGNYNVFERKFEENILKVLVREHGYTLGNLVDRYKTYLSNEDYRKAVLDLEESRSMHPNNVLILFLLAEAYEYVRDKDNAISSYEKAIEHSQSSVRTYLETQLHRVKVQGCKKPGMKGLRHMSW